jgi:hypothetical protein
VEGFRLRFGIFSVFHIQCSNVQYSMLSSWCFCAQHLILVSSDWFLVPGAKDLGIWVCGLWHLGAELAAGGTEDFRIIRVCDVQDLTLRLGGLKI